MHSPKTVRSLVIGLAMTASLLTLTWTRTANASQNSSVEKKIIFADGSDPMPACRKKVCPPIE